MGNGRLSPEEFERRFPQPSQINPPQLPDKSAAIQPEAEKSLVLSGTLSENSKSNQPPRAPQLIASAHLTQSRPPLPPVRVLPPLEQERKLPFWYKVKRFAGSALFLGALIGASIQVNYYSKNIAECNWKDNFTPPQDLGWDYEEGEPLKPEVFAGLKVNNQLLPKAIAKGGTSEKGARFVNPQKTNPVTGINRTSIVGVATYDFLGITNVQSKFEYKVIGEGQGIEIGINPISTEHVKVVMVGVIAQNCGPINSAGIVEGLNNNLDDLTKIADAFKLTPDYITPGSTEPIQEAH